jgi:hypothetical protein
LRILHIDVPLSAKRLLLRTFPRPRRYPRPPHLMQAIGQQTIERRKIQKVVYLSSRRCSANEWQRQRIAFKKKYNEPRLADY